MKLIEYQTKEFSSIANKLVRTKNVIDVSGLKKMIYKKAWLILFINKEQVVIKGEYQARRVYKLLKDMMSGK